MQSGSNTVVSQTVLGHAVKFTSLLGSTPIHVVVDGAKARTVEVRIDSNMG